MAAEWMSEVMNGVKRQAGVLEFLASITFLLACIGLQFRKLPARDLAVDSTERLSQFDHALDLLTVVRRIVDLKLLNVVGSVAHNLFAKCWIECPKE